MLVVFVAPVQGAVTAGTADAPGEDGAPAGGVVGNNSSELATSGFNLRLADASEDVVFGDDVAYLWTSTTQTTNLEVRAPAASNYDHYQVCLSVIKPGTDTTREVGCKQLVASGALDRNLTLTWQASETGPRKLVATLVGTTDTGTQVLLRNNSRVHLMEKTGDVDNDKLTNADELKAGTNLTDTDTDDDGLLDGAEVTEYDTSPLNADTDADGVRDAVEIQQGTNPMAMDTDGDGVPDNVEVEGPTDPTITDSDADGASDQTELEMETDPTQADTDGDGMSDGTELGAGTDPTLADTDGDLLDDGLERQLGTAPTAMWSPALPLGMGIGALVAAGFLAWRRREDADGDDVEADDAHDDPPQSDEEAAEEEPLTDRDRILRLLKRAGGQLKQTRIVEETDWSKAKVSRVLSQMEEDGAISKIRIGRENLICLKGNEPDLARPSI